MHPERAPILPPLGVTWDRQPDPPSYLVAQEGKGHILKGVPAGVQLP